MLWSKSRISFQELVSKQIVFYSELQLLSRRQKFSVYHTSPLFLKRKVYFLLVKICELIIIWSIMCGKHQIVMMENAAFSVVALRIFKGAVSRDFLPLFFHDYKLFWLLIHMLNFSSIMVPISHRQKRPRCHWYRWPRFPGNIYTAGSISAVSLTPRSKKSFCPIFSRFFNGIKSGAQMG